MENRKYVKILALIFSLGLFILGYRDVSAYEVDTHAFLTDQIIRFYNQNFPNQKLSNELEVFLIDGSRREDDAPRWMNHFYDPVNNRGLSYDPAIDPINVGNWQKSKDWAGDSGNQNSLTYKVPATIASVLTAIQEGKISALSAETDFTWDKAVNLYASGDKEKGLFVLGHILHLVEDASVPDHTRNDPHPGDSPYESWTSQFTLNNPDNDLFIRVSNKAPVIEINLGAYFDGIAKYSNNNFYSNDTIGIQSGYNLPQPDFNVSTNNGRFAVKEDKETGDYYLFRKLSGNSYFIETKLTTTLKDDYVNKDYWSHLSTQSVRYGAGVINLFFQEVEKMKNNPNLAKPEDKSFLSQVVDAIKNAAGKINLAFTNTLSGTLNSNGNFNEAGVVALDNNINKTVVANNKQENAVDSQSTVNQLGVSNAEILTYENAPSFNANEPIMNQNNTVAVDSQQNDPPVQQENKPVSQTQTATVTQLAVASKCSFNTSQSPLRQSVIINEVAWMGSVNSANDEWIELKNVSGDKISLSGWQLINKSEKIKVDFDSGDKISANGFYLLERTDDNSVPGVTASKIYTGALSNTSEGLRLFDSNCNLVDDVLAASDWPAGDATSRKTMERNQSDFGWHTSSDISGTPKKENSQPVNTSTAPYNGGGGSAGTVPTNNPQQNSESPAKILISEAQITGGVGKTDNDFIELYNPNDKEVNLKGYRLVKRTKTGISDISVKSWTVDALIAPHSYYLWANSNYTGISATPDATTTGTISDNNGVAIRFGAEDTGTIIDSVGWGEAQNAFIEGTAFATNPAANKSIQRKFQDNTFLDTDKNIDDFELRDCPSPKAQSAHCDQSSSNLPPVAFFIFSPQNPEVSSTVNFNAASSSDPDGTVVLYDWDFGDGQSTSSTQATSTHAFGVIGDYEMRLTVYDDQNASSTATSTISVVEPAPPSISTPSDFNIIFTYASGTPELILKWQQSVNTTGVTSTYKINDTNGAISPSNPLIVTTEATSTRVPIGQLGRDYAFSIQAFGGGGLSSGIATSSISIPTQVSPIMPSNLGFELDECRSLLRFYWDSSYDPDTAQDSIAYEVSIDDGGSWQATNAHNRSYQFSIESNGVYNLGVRAVDSYNLRSETATSTFTIPHFPTGTNPAKNVCEYVSDPHGWLGQSLGSGLSGNLTSITIHMNPKVWTNNNTQYILLYEGNGPDGGLFSKTFSPSEIGVENDYTFTSGYTLDPSKNYTFMAQFQEMIPVYYWGSGSADTYASGTVIRGFPWAEGTGPIKDLYFVLGFTE